MNDCQMIESASEQHFQTNVEYNTVPIKPIECPKAHFGVDLVANDLKRQLYLFLFNAVRRGILQLLYTARKQILICRIVILGYAI